MFVLRGATVVSQLGWRVSRGGAVPGRLGWVALFAVDAGRVGFDGLNTDVRGCGDLGATVPWRPPARRCEPVSGREALLSPGASRARCGREHLPAGAARLWNAGFRQ